jgi:hypothetical protein
MIRNTTARTVREPMYSTYGTITAAATPDITRKAPVIRWPGFRIPGP